MKNQQVRYWSYFGENEIAGHAASRAVEAETAGASFGIVVSQVKVSFFASVATLAFHVSLRPIELQTQQKEQKLEVAQLNTVLVSY